MNRSLTKRRLIVYIVLSFGITWSVFYLGDCKSVYTGDPSRLGAVCSYLTMLCPAISNFLTRAITKEGLKDSKLKINVVGNFKYYVLSVVALVVLGLLTGIVTPLVYVGKVELTVSPMAFMGSALNLIGISMMFWLIYFGEEFGWRGYLFPKLEELFGTRKSILISGVVWGVWHTPMLLEGHSFGKDLVCYPVSNILLMCVFCTGMGAFLTYLTKRTNSIYPASIAHALTNNFAGVLIGYFISEENLQTFTPWQSISVLWVLVASLGAISIFKLLHVR